MEKLLLKKLFCAIGLTIILTLNMGLALAQGTISGGTGSSSGSGSTAGSSGGTPAPASGSQPTPLSVDMYLPFAGYTGVQVDDPTKLAAVEQLPKTDYKQTIVYVIRVMLNITAGLTLLALTIGGAMMMLAGGEGQMLNMGKQIVIDVSIGVIIIALAYAIVVGVAELNFFGT